MHRVKGSSNATAPRSNSVTSRKVVHAVLATVKAWLAVGCHADRMIRKLDRQRAQYVSHEQEAIMLLIVWVNSSSECAGNRCEVFMFTPRARRSNATNTDTSGTATPPRNQKRTRLGKDSNIRSDAWIPLSRDSWQSARCAWHCR